MEVEACFMPRCAVPAPSNIQSLPFSRLADRIIASAPIKGGSAREEGSILGGLGNLLHGDNRF